MKFEAQRKAEEERRRRELVTHTQATCVLCPEVKLRLLFLIKKQILSRS